MSADNHIDVDWFTRLQEDLNYQQAQQSLRNLVQHLDLCDDEKKGLETEINHLSEMLERLDQFVVQIAAFGLVGRGKSSLLNALVGHSLFQTGPLHGVTQTVESTKWVLTEDENLENVQRLTLLGLGNSKIHLIDTPGLDEVAGEAREALACEMAKKVDLILFVIAGDITNVEYQALSKLREAGKPIILVFNKIDQYPEADRLAIYQKICDERVKQLLSPDEIVMVSASPLETEAIKNAIGRVKIERKRGKPQIDDLKLKIIEILQREGKSLVALNTLLVADEVNEQIVQRKMEIREERANQLIYQGMMIKASAIALNPVTVLDLFSGAVIDVALILSLSRFYNLPMTQRAAIGLLQKIGVSMGGISASEFLASLGLSSLKGLLGITIPLSGGLSLAPYLSVAITQASVAGVTSYAIGQITKTYLANGASWGEDGTKAVVKRILTSLDETSILNRIKWELGEKLNYKL